MSPPEGAVWLAQGWHDECVSFLLRMLQDVAQAARDAFPDAAPTRRQLQQRSMWAKSVRQAHCQRVRVRQKMARACSEISSMRVLCFVHARAQQSNGHEFFVAQTNAIFVFCTCRSIPGSCYRLVKKAVRNPIPLGNPIAIEFREVCGSSGAT